MSKNNCVVKAEYLYNNSGNHDKVYNIAICTKENQYEVVVEYGARTSVLRELLKYAGPSLETANVVYNKLISEKTSSTKGYKISSSGDRSGKSNLINLSTSGIDKTLTKLKQEKEAGVTHKVNKAYDHNATPERRLDIEL
jgi:hypothetical protein